MLTTLAPPLTCQPNKAVQRETMNPTPAHARSLLEINDGDASEATLTAASAAAAAVDTHDLLPTDFLGHSSEETQNQDHHQRQHHTAELFFQRNHEFDHPAGMNRPISEIYESSANVFDNQKNKRHKHCAKFPPPSSEIVVGYHENDVLCGRGATINAHPGERDPPSIEKLKQSILFIIQTRLFTLIVSLFFLLINISFSLFLSSFQYREPNIS